MPSQVTRDSYLSESTCKSGTSTKKGPSTKSSAYIRRPLVVTPQKPESPSNSMFKRSSHQMRNQSKENSENKSPLPMASGNKLNRNGIVFEERVYL